MRCSSRCIVFVFQLWCGATLLACGTAERKPDRDAPRWETTHQILDTQLGNAGPTPTPWLAAADEHGGARFFGVLQPISVYDANGSRILSLGRTGRGPGEFSRVATLGFVGDTMWAYDQFLDRITYYDDRNVLARTVSPTGLPRFSGRAEKAASIAGISSGGTAFLVEEISPPGKPADPRWIALAKVPSTQLGTTSVMRDARQIDSLGPSTFVRVPTAKKDFLRFSNPFDDGDIYAFAPNGSLVAVVRRKVIPDQPTGSFTLTIHGTSGVLRTDTIPYSPVATTDAMVEAAWLDQWGRLPDLIRKTNWPSQAAGRNLYINALPPHTQLAPVVRVLVGNDSTVWLQRASSGDSARWEVYDTHGRVIGQFDLPRTFKALTASGTFIWGTEPDQEGETRFARYRITRK
jgi:hypothetical protein